MIAAHLTHFGGGMTSTGTRQHVTTALGLVFAPRVSECPCRQTFTSRLSSALFQSVKMRDLRTAGNALGKPAGSKSPHPGSALYSILMPVPIVQWFDRLTMAGSIFRSSWATRRRMRFVQDVNCEGTTRLKLALLYWICRRPDKGRGRGQQSREHGAREPSGGKYRDRDSWAWIRIASVRVWNFHVSGILETSKW